MVCLFLSFSTFASVRKERPDRGKKPTAQGNALGIKRMF